MEEDKTITEEVTDESAIEEVEAVETVEPEIQTEETEVEEEKETEESTEDEVDKTEKPTSPRENKRIQRLLDKLQVQEEAKKEAPTLTPKQIEEGDYTLDQINAMFKEGQQEAYTTALQKAQESANATTFATRLEIDAPKMHSKYPYLDPESDEFDPGRSEFVNRLFLTTVGYDDKTGIVKNTGLRYNEFIEGFQEMVELSTNSQRADSTKNIAKQAAQTGIRPGGVTKTVYQGDDPRKMTDAQLDAAIANMLPKR
jgi:hypothetical protein